MFPRSFNLISLCLPFVFIVTSAQSQSWDELHKRVASDRSAGDEFGEVVALHGLYAAVGVTKEAEDAEGNNSLANAGAVYVYEDMDGTWEETQKLVASDRSQGDRFGSSVAISDDFIFVGAVNETEDAEGNNSFGGAGAVYVFQKIDNIWTQIQKLVASDRSGLSVSNFGTALSISGNTLAIGAKSESKDAEGLNPLSGAGAAYIFEYVNDTWIETQKIVAFDRNLDDEFGISLSLDHDRLVIGAGLQDLDENGENEIENAF